MYPLGRYWSVNPAETFWLPLAISDPALFHVLLFCTDGAMTRLSGGKERPTAIEHMRQAISILNSRFEDPSQEISDSTIGAVCGLALAEVRKIQP